MTDTDAKAPGTTGHSRNAGRRSGPLVVALVGRPNAGKTSMLMHLTGTAQRPVNFPGTSVERAEGRAKHDGRDFEIVDLPGIVSLRAVSRDEEVAIDYLRGAEVDVVCAVLDATRLSIELRLLDTLREAGHPLVVALTKQDVAARQGRVVDVDALAREIGVQVHVVDGFHGGGFEPLLAAFARVGDAARSGARSDPLAPFDPDAVAELVQARPEPRTTWSDRFDAILLHWLCGPLVLVGVVLLMFQTVFTVAEPFMGWIETAQGLLSDGVSSVVPEGALQSFLVDGLVNGLGSAFIFVPQIALLIALITVLESTGYMARAVCLLDRMLGSVGLTGRSFVPLTNSFACAIPGILGSRIIDDERDRLTTIVVAPLMSCSARLPVYVVLLAAFFLPERAGLWLAGMYVIGIVTAALVALVLRSTILRGAGRSFLAMEMPVYQRPNLRNVWMQVRSAVMEFLRVAGSFILVSSVVIWALSYYPRPASVGEAFEQQRAEIRAESGGIGGGPGEEERSERLDRIDRRERAAYLEQSFLAGIGKAVQPVFALAGFDWRQTVAVLAAFPARELVIPTLGTLHSLGDVEADAGNPDPGLIEALRRGRDDAGRPTMNALVALAMMVFFALCSQCAATLAAIRRETRSWFWPVFTFTYMTGLAWVAAVLVYQVGCLLGYGTGAA